MERTSQQLVQPVCTDILKCFYAAFFCYIVPWLVIGDMNIHLALYSSLDLLIYNNEGTWWGSLPGYVQDPKALNSSQF